MITMEVVALSMWSDDKRTGIPRFNFLFGDNYLSVRCAQRHGGDILLFDCSFVHWGFLSLNWRSKISS